MTRFVLDCSVTASWCFSDESDPYAMSALDALEDGEAVVPSIWPLELANVLLIGERRGRLSRTEVVQFVSLLTELEILIDRIEPDRVFSEILSLAWTHKLTSYDAAYLDLAMREGLPIATLDEPLRKAAEAAGVGIATF